jgi:hypothetical protein
VYFVGNIVQVNACSDDKYRKVKVVPVYAIKALWGSGGIAPLILNLGTR